MSVCECITKWLWEYTDWEISKGNKVEILKWYGKLVWMALIHRYKTSCDVKCFKFNCWHAALNLHPGSESLDIQSSNSIVDILLWTYIQEVSYHGHSELKFNCWHAPVNLHPVCELPWNSELKFNCWHAPVNLHLASESSWTFRVQIQLLTCSCELAFRQWVTMDIQAQIQLLMCYCKFAFRQWVTMDIQSSYSIANMLL